MKRLALRLIVVVLVVAVCSSTARAQFTVFDPSNYAQAVLQVQHLIRQYQFLVQQTKRLPNMAGRYRRYTPGWAPHDLGRVFYAGGILGGLNDGDASGAGYRSMAHYRDSFPDVAWRMPEALRGPLATSYANIELADSVATMAIDQIGQMRQTTNLMMYTIEGLEDDAYSSNDDLQTQTAILNKINAANVVGLRLTVQNHQLLGESLEQLIVDNKRKRDSEMRIMNATIHQWRYGQAYGVDLFSNTAANIDGWRPF